MNKVNKKLLISIMIFILLVFVTGGILYVNNKTGDLEQEKLNKVEEPEPLEQLEPPQEILESEKQTELIPEEEQEVEPEQVPTQETTINQSSNLTPADFRVFTGEEFRVLGDNFNYIGTTPTTTRPHIRGDQEADSRIQRIAEKRGYRLRPQADCRCLLPQVREAYNKINQTIQQETGNSLVFVSGFRSIEDQRNIFLNAISAWTNQSIAEGRADEAINQILITRSIPGYSKHHTGYVIDFGCNNSDLINFKNTACYRWLSDNNYFNAKRFGFIPSYPSGAVNQGPDPEEWEYIYIGVDNLLR